MVGFKNKDQRDKPTTMHSLMLLIEKSEIYETYHASYKSKSLWSAPIRLCLMASRVHVVSLSLSWHRVQNAAVLAAMLTLLPH